MRKLTIDPFQKIMGSGNSALAMNCASSKGFSKWTNKDIKEVELTGDWTALLEKAKKSTKYFRNHFYS